MFSPSVHLQLTVGENEKESKKKPNFGLKALLARGSAHGWVDL